MTADGEREKAPPRGAQRLLAEDGGGVEMTMTAGRMSWVIERTCHDRQRYEDPRVARSAAWRFRNVTLRPIRAYRCPFGDGTEEDEHWHVGHVPSMTVLHRIAEAIRVRSAAEGPRSAA